MGRLQETWSHCPRKHLGGPEQQAIAVEQLAGGRDLHFVHVDPVGASEILDAD
jgi:hypothetical protein